LLRVEQLPIRIRAVGTLVYCNNVKIILHFLCAPFLAGGSDVGYDVTKGILQFTVFAPEIDSFEQYLPLAAKNTTHFWCLAVISSDI